MDIHCIRQTGIVLFDDFMVDPSTPLLDQLDALKEDMFQAEVKGKYLLDIGGDLPSTLMARSKFY